MENNIDHVKHIAEIIKPYGYKFEDTRAHYYLKDDNPEQENIKSLILIPEELNTTNDAYISGIYQDGYTQGKEDGFAEGRTAGIEEGTLVGKKEVFDFVIGLIGIDDMTLALLETGLHERYPELVPPPVDP